MRLRVYLDTSVFSAYLDERVPDRRAETAEFWARLAHFEAATSEVCREEMLATPDPARRGELLGLLNEVQVFEVSDEMRRRADTSRPASSRRSCATTRCISPRQCWEARTFWYPGTSGTW